MLDKSSLDKYLHGYHNFQPVEIYLKNLFDNQLTAIFQVVRKDICLNFGKQN